MDSKDRRLDAEITPADKLAAKKAAIMGAKKSKVPSWIAALVIAVAVVAAGAVWGIYGPSKEVAKAPGAGMMFSYVPNSGEVSYPTSDFADATPRFYQHKAEGGVIVRYFVVKAQDGTFSAALDTCASCWQSGRGHRVEGEMISCPVCGKEFALAKLGEYKDACAPLALPVSVKAGSVAIAIPDLLGGTKYFRTNIKDG